ncbi:glycosyltransferase family 4 protein [Chloroflexota bacterium]
MNKLKICFLALASYPLLMHSKEALVGGAEVQQVLLAEELIKDDLIISFIVFDHGQKQAKMVNGITLYKTIPKDYRLNSPLSLFRATRIFWKAMKLADADIYFQRASNKISSLVAIYCLLHKKKYIHSIASDKSVNGMYTKQAGSLMGWLYAFAIKRADIVLTQSKYQQKLLRTRFHKDSTIVKNAYPLVIGGSNMLAFSTILWVGTISRLKRPELYLELAKNIPTAKFQMIGGKDYNEPLYYQIIKEETEKIPNLDFLGFLPFHMLHSYFNQASILVNTSSVEGFPNTFLQAWSCGIPVVSLDIDPDEIICDNKLGLHSKTLKQLVADVRRLQSQKQLRDEISQNARQYVEKEHNLEQISRIYLDLFQSVLISRKL